MRLQVRIVTFLTKLTEKKAIRSMEKVPMTTYGYKKLEADLKNRVNVLRPKIIADIEEARAHGDLSENAEYHAAKEQQAINEGMINMLQDKIARAEVVDPTKLKGDRIMMGATVELADCDTDEEKLYILVGPDEADIDQGLISVTSPLGRSLIGKEEGDEASFHAPGGNHTYEVLSVKYQEISL